MKIAILILLHEYTEQQKMLVNQLSSDFDVFVHIDKKSTVGVKDVEQDTVFAFKEYKVYWGSFTQILATLFLFEKAYTYNKSGGGYNRYILISGADIPLKTNREIMRFFENNTVEYFEYHKLPKPQWSRQNGGFDRMDFYHFNYDRRKKRLSINKLLNAANERIVIPMLRFLHIKRKRFCSEYFGGANWMDLTNSCVSQILDFLKHTPDYVKSFKFTRCADEIFFHTIIMNYVSGVTVENNSLRYIDWHTGPEFPRTLRMEDYASMKESGMLFARKFDLKTDSDIIYRLYSDIEES